MSHVTPYLDELKKKAEQLDFSVYEAWLEKTYAEWLALGKDTLLPLTEKSQEVIKKADLNALKKQMEALRKRALKKNSTYGTIKASIKNKLCHFASLKKVMKNKPFLIALALGLIVLIVILAKNNQPKEKRTRSLW